MKKNSNLNIIPALLILAGVIVAVVLGSMYAFEGEDETLQGQVEVTEYRVSGKVPGRVLEILVHEGDFVHKGDILAVIEAPEVDAKLLQAQAAEAAASALSDKAQNGAQKEDIQGAYELWQKAIAAKDVMEKSYVRIKRLTDEGVMPQQKLDEITAQRDAAIATERAAKSQYDKALSGARQEDKRAAAAQVKRAQGAITEVNAYKRETKLVASADGEVTEIFPQVGELVGTGAPVMNVAVTSDLWMTFNVREDHLSRLPMKQKVKLTIPALGGKEVEGVVYFMKDLGSYAAWKATKTTGQFDMKTFEVRVRPTSMPDGLRPGMSVLIKK
ncbi:MAG: efflux RND transporter periplasmic adaptor subunit [Alloprevotella sp.]|nr:efflux RND transporter periplasmic adaptor subunit [Alloprevotella sp.]